jgi:hypothetical protein
MWSSRPWRMRRRTDLEGCLPEYLSIQIGHWNVHVFLLWQYNTNPTGSFVFGSDFGSTLNMEYCA